MREFEDFILNRDHPCLMAQTVFRQGQYELNEYGRLGEESHTQKLLNDIRNYVESYDFSKQDFFSFIAVFEDEGHMPEEHFEKRLWQQLQLLHNEDSSPWDSEVSSDPDSDQFSFSLCGRAFYVVGMHPGSSRMARQAPRPAVVFNLHWQFEKLREMGAYETTRSTIRQRDKEKQGSLNPMLKDFGESREAMQYSGREVDESWKCPFHAKSNS